MTEPRRKDRQEGNKERNARTDDERRCRKKEGGEERRMKESAGKLKEGRKQ